MLTRYFHRAKITGNRSDSGKWISGFLYGIWEKQYFILWGMTNSIPYLTEVDASTICQCTNLKDKNGNLIWENDIVDFLGHRGIIKYECGSFGIEFKYTLDKATIQSSIDSNISCVSKNIKFIPLRDIYWDNFNNDNNYLRVVELVGNIFDNPELLEMEE